MARSFRRTATRFALAGGVCIAALAIADRSAPIVSSLNVPLSGGYTLTTGKIHFSNGLIGSALAQSAGNVTIENIEVVSATGTLRIPSITFQGATLSRDELTAILSGTGDGPLWQRLSRISAQSMAAPTVEISYDVDGISQSLTYSNMSATSIVDGRIAQMSAESGSFEIEANDGSGTGEMGRTSVSGLDVPHLVRFYTEAAVAGEPNPHRTVYESVSVDAFQFSDGEEVEMRIARISGSEVSVRLLDQTFDMIMTDMSELEGRDDLSREEAMKLISIMVDMFDSVGFGNMEATAISLRNLEDEDITITIDRMAMSNMEGSAVLTGAIEGVAVDTPQGSVSIDSMSSEGFSFTPMREAFATMQANPATQLDRNTALSLLPDFGTFRISGVNSNFTMDDSGDDITFSMREMEITATEPRGGIPTNGRFAFEKIAFDLPADTGEESIERLRELGYERINVSGAVAARWNQPANELVISEVSFSGEDMGSIALRGVLGSMSENIFSPNQAVAMVALMGGTVKNLHLMIDNEGLAERVIEMQAKDMGTTADALRMQFGMMATAMLPAMLGNSEQARALSQAIGQFVASPGELEISATAKENGGIAFTEFLSISQPAALLEKIDLSATSR